MRAVVIAFFLTFAGAAQGAAACYADYKAKKDNPLRLHYGIAALPDAVCAAGINAAAAEIAPRLEADGWQLLSVLSLFGEEGLDQRRQDAGEYLLRY
jgi:hypothetical protein